MSPSAGGQDLPRTAPRLAPGQVTPARGSDEPFRPYGATIGHGFEWARLTLYLDAALGDGAGALLSHEVALFDRAVADGWSVDGAPGFVYTTDWDGTPVVRNRMHWVVNEATNAAAALHRATGDDRYAADYRNWWAYAQEHHIDLARGSWIHELDEANRPAASVWPASRTSTMRCRRRWYPCYHSRPHWRRRSSIRTGDGHGPEGGPLG